MVGWSLLARLQSHKVTETLLSWGGKSCPDVTPLFFLSAGRLPIRSPGGRVDYISQGGSGVLGAQILGRHVRATSSGDHGWGGLDGKRKTSNNFTKKTGKKKLDFWLEAQNEAS